MAIDAKEAMTILEDEMNKADEKGSGLAPFFFSIKDGEKALITPLLNMSQYVLVNKHEIFNPAINKFDVAAICAFDLQLQCQYCLDVVNNKKLTAGKRFVLPIYVHAVINVKTGAYVTYKDKDGVEHNVSGVRLLEMKRTSSILRDLVASYNGTDDSDVKAANNITKLSYVIRRENVDGDKLQTRYTVTPKQARELPEDIPAWTRDRNQVLLQYADACPFKIVNNERDVPPALQSSKPANGNGGKVKSVPDF